MINFRYHVVSLTAVFLALAIGLVVGTAALNGPVADSLNEQVNTLGRTNGDLREQVDHLTTEASGKEDFLRQAAPRLIGGSLAGRRVLLLGLPGVAAEQVDGVRAMLVTAGAKVTGRLELQEKFVDPASSVELLDLADRPLAPTIPAATLPGNSDGVEKASALLGAVLLDRSPAVPVADLRAVLAAYATAGHVAVVGPVAGPAEVAILVAGLPYPDKDAAARNKNALTAAAQLDRVGRLVVAGAGVGDGSVVAGVRADPTLSKTISTVDNAATAQGQLVTAMATAGQLTNGVGQYGVGAGAQALLPGPLR